MLKPRLFLFHQYLIFLIMFFACGYRFVLPHLFLFFNSEKGALRKNYQVFYLSLTFFPNLFFLVYFLFLVFISFLPSINTRAILLHHSVFPQCLEWVVRSFFLPCLG
jgi:hypothetical protein